MKLTANTILWLFLSFIWSIFMGITAGSIGVGAIYPPLNLVAKPFVCPNGKMFDTEVTSNPYPGTTYTQITWVCQDNQTGAKKELGMFPMSLYSGAYIGLALFVVVVVIWYLSARRNAARAAASPDREWESPPAERYNQRGGRSGDAVARMKELKALRDADTISEAEYQKKRAEILKDL